MASNNVTRIWLDPFKYWAVTDGMSAEERRAMSKTIDAAIDARDTALLRKVPFLRFTDPVAEWREHRRKSA